MWTVDVVLFIMLVVWWGLGLLSAAWHSLLDRLSPQPAEAEEGDEHGIF